MGHRARQLPAPRSSFAGFHFPPNVTLTDHDRGSLVPALWVDAPMDVKWLKAAVCAQGWA